MIARFIRWWLKRYDKQYLVNFWDGVTKLGSPGDVAFPIELIEQGAGLVLSGLNNTLAIHSHLNWVWPFWVEKQQDPTLKDFIPTGVNTLTLNLSHRNWVSIGVPNFTEEAMVDPVGMLTPNSFGWSIFPYIKQDKQSYFPPRLFNETKQFITDNSAVKTIYHLPTKLQWHSEIDTCYINNIESIRMKIVLKNPTNMDVALTLGTSIRPYNALSVSRIEHLKFKKNTWAINHKNSIYFNETPDRNIISSNDRLDVLTAKQEHQSKKIKSDTGMLTALSEFDLQLAPNSEKTLLLTIPLGKKSLSLNSNKSIIKEIDYNESGIQLDFPDKKLLNAFNTIKKRLHVFDDGSHFTPGTYFYHHHWVRDSYFISRAFIETGLHGTLKKKINTLLSIQTQNGFFRSQNGEWDSNGQAICMIVDICKQLDDRDLLNHVFPKLVKAVEWIDSMRKKAIKENPKHKGLLPSGFSAEHFGPNDHYLWDNFWSIAGIREALRMAKLLNRDEDRNYLRTIYDEYSCDFNDVIRRMTQESKHLATSPFREPDSASIGNLIAISPLHLFPKESHWFKSTVNFLYENFIVQGLFYQKIFHTGLNPYLSVQLAKSLLILGDERYKVILNSLMSFGGNTFTWPEAINPQTGGGCMGDGDHGWAAAEFISLVRFLFVYEDERSLYLGAGITKDWYTIGQDIIVKDAPTTYGILNYSLKFNENKCILSWDLSINSLQEKPSLYFLLAKDSQYYYSPSFNHSEHMERIHIDELSGKLVFNTMTLKRVSNE